jgi:transcriptional regulator with XRE-family HTH domain
MVKRSMAARGLTPATADRSVSRPDRSEVRRALGQAIRAAYTGKFTQTELAGLLGVAQNTVSRWSTGDVEPSLADLLEIEQACGLTRGHILRTAGLVSETVTAEEVIAADTRLDPPRRELLLAAYQAAVRQSKR